MSSIDFATPETAIVVSQIFPIVAAELIGTRGFSSGSLGRRANRRRVGRTRSGLARLETLLETPPEFNIASNISSFPNKSVQGFFSFQRGNQPVTDGLV